MMVKVTIFYPFDTWLENNKRFKTVIVEYNSKEYHDLIDEELFHNGHNVGIQVCYE